MYTHLHFYSIIISHGGLK